LNATQELQVHTDDVSILGENTSTIMKNKEALLQDSREVGLEVNTDKTISRHQNAGHNHNLLTANKSFDNVEKLEHLGNNSNKSKLHSLRNKEQINLGGCLLTFCSVSCLAVPKI
jgi:hypothetical protein